VLAASQDKQFELTAAACAAGKDVFLLRPLPFHSPALKDVVQEAARQGRQVQIARETAFALEAGSAIGLAAASGAGITGAEIEAWFQTPEPPDGKPLFNDLLDEVDFAQAVVGGLVERSVTVGGPAILPGCWIDRRLHFKITDQQGIEKWMSINLIATHGSAALKATRTILRGDRGTAELAGLPLPAGNRMDLSAFLSAVRSREAGVGLSLSRTAQLNEQFLEVGKF
jgi:predicted dehydrogenase